MFGFGAIMLPFCFPATVGDLVAILIHHLRLERCGSRTTHVRAISLEWLRAAAEEYSPDEVLQAFQVIPLFVRRRPSVSRGSPPILLQGVSELWVLRLIICFVGFLTTLRCFDSVEMIVMVN